MLKILIAHKEKNTRGGFSVNDLTPILHEMIEDKTIIERPIIHGSRYFLNKESH